MNTKHQVHNLIILDESGSMFSIKDQIIRGFNEVVQTIQSVEEKYPEQEHFISFLTFNGMGITEHLFNKAVKNLQEIDEESYRPGATTPLFDAIGHGVSKLEKIIDNSANHDVLVTILTDGEENASKEYTREVIKNKIEELKHKRWTFTYTGTDHDVYSAAGALSINNVVQFKKSEADMEEMFLNEREARLNYSAYIRSGKDIGEKFYKKDLKQKYDLSKEETASLEQYFLMKTVLSFHKEDGGDFLKNFKCLKKLIKGFGFAIEDHTTKGDLRYKLPSY